MARTNKIETGSLDKIIIGRVDPYIYAFTTETIPNYLKVGDTYRPLEIRLSEWKNYFPNLKKQFSDVAKVDEETFFRDYAIHLYLEQNKHKTRLDKASVPKGAYYSNEFFKETDVKDVKDAICDIKDSHTRNDGKYQFYKFNVSRIPEKHTYRREEDYTPRPNQREAIDNFKTAVANGRTNLLMYAVMRFGKSFTSMCCATEMGADVVVIVSAKADVKEEWKKTVESHIRFEGYDFLDSGNLSQDYSIVTKKLEEGKKVVMFLTLQDLMGDAIKEKHKEVFERQIDLLIIDETHFGARGEEFGKVLRKELNLTSKEMMGENNRTNDEDLIDLNEKIKILSSKVRLHLSGTPYRILMGDEFKPEDIVSFCQFSDIVEAQKKWDEENLDKEDTDKTKIEEWKNPYYGFPQMVRFAFHPNASVRKRLDELRQNGVTCAFSALFKPRSIQKDAEGGKHKVFEHEKEVLDLLEVIDGSKEDEELFGFLDYDKIKEGQMCRHIVCVLPFRASCDALEKLITDNKKKFKNLSQYEIVNISGVENDRLYPDTNAVKAKIHSCERDNQKTITLTVNRMLTGSTVEEWDTMLYLKDTSSPQEYDQATFRLQNQYIRKYTDDSGEEISYNMKPQTLLVDLDPNRMFVMQELKSQIYNVNTDKNGNSKLEERIKTELRISPIITVNRGRIVAVEATNIMDAVREYSKDRSVVDEATAIPVDYSLLEIEEIRAEIEKQAKIGSKQGLKIVPSKGEGTDIDTPQDEEENGATTDSIPTPTDMDLNNKEDDIEKKFATYYSRILFFAFLTKGKVKSLEEVIAEISTADGQRIAENLDLRVDVLTLLQRNVNSFIRRNLEYKIDNINTLANDSSLEPIDRASVAMRKFGRLSASEIVTPEKVADEMVSILPKKELKKGVEMLDLASKQGEFVYAVYKAFGENGVKNFYSIPTSKVAYEFTRKVYELLGLDISHIECKYNSYDLIRKETPMINDNKIMINEKTRKFRIILGNPPYQDQGGSGGNNDAPLYQHFSDVSEKSTVRYSSLIIPSRWFSAGRENLLGDFRSHMLSCGNISLLSAYTNGNTVFPNVEIKGGICYYLFDAKHKGKCRYSLIRDNQSSTITRKLDDFDVLIREPVFSEIVKKVGKMHSNDAVDTIVSSDTPFGISSNVRESKKNSIPIYENCTSEHNTQLYHIEKSKRTIEYVSRQDIKKNAEYIDKYKVFVPGGYGAGESFPHQILGMPEYAPKNSVCSQSYLFVAFDTEPEARNFIKYLKTRFFRSLVAAIKISQSAPSRAYRFVPLQDFTSNSDIDWSKSVADIDLQLYDKYGLTTEERQFIEQMIRPM